jgi:ubiquinol-cytochrome c reductase cytochrome c subunit
MRRLSAIGVLALVLVPAARPAGDVVRGGHLYGRYCLACHGANGSGVSGGEAGFGPGRNETVQKRLGPPLRGVGALSADFYLRTGYMPLGDPHEQPARTRVQFREREIRALEDYVDSLGGGPPVPAPDPEAGSVSQGLQLFTEHCAGCHQVVAEGGVVTDASVPPLDKATPVQVAQAVRIGPYVMPEFSERAISDAELDSIIAYVRYAQDPDDRGGLGIGHLGPFPEGIVAWLIAGVVLVGFCVLIGERVGRA